MLYKHNTGDSCNRHKQRVVNSFCFWLKQQHTSEEKKKHTQPKKTPTHTETHRSTGQNIHTNTSLHNHRDTNSLTSHGSQVGNNWICKRSKLEKQWRWCRCQGDGSGKTSTISVGQCSKPTIFMGGDSYSALWRRPVASNRHSFHFNAAVFYPATAALQKSMPVSTLKLLTTVKIQEPECFADPPDLFHMSSREKWEGPSDFFSTGGASW